MSLITKNDPDFPPKLKHISPPVETLFYKGELDTSIFTNCLAVVGSRRMTSYGSRVIERLLPPLIEEKITIVSGGMYGTDCAAHRMCIDCGGRTIAVLGWGIASTDDTEIYRLEQKLLDNHGLILSEYDGSQKPQLWMFPQRNRIVAALCRAVLITEAGLGSGTLVTARWAQKYQVPVLAVPGPITSTVSEGTNFLIKSGLATAVTSVQDLYEALELVKKKSSVQSDQITETNPILQALSLEERSVDELAAFLGKSVGEIASEIALLELSGKVKYKAGKYYI